MSMFLTRDQLGELSGRKQRTKVCEWLLANGYKFEMAADGWPRVLRAAMEAKLMPSTAKRSSADQQPDFSRYG